MYFSFNITDDSFSIGSTSNKNITIYINNNLLLSINIFNIINIIFIKN